MSRISGSSLLSSFDDQLTRSSADIERCEREVAQKEREVAQGNQRRETALLRLVDVFCEEREKFQQEISSVSREIQTLFDEKSKRRLGVEDDLARCRQIIAQGHADLDRARIARDEAAREREQLAQSVDKLLHEDADFISLVRTLDDLRGRASELKSRFAAIDEEVAEKLRAYNDNDFFRYLVRRKYGTDEYKSHGRSARIDGWIAEKIKWSDNFPNYCLLKELPNYTRKLVADLEKSIEVTSARINVRSQETQSKVGFDEAKLKHERRCHSVEELEKKVGELEKQLATLSNERNALQDNRDPYVQKAKEAIKRMLSGESIRDLQTRARRTNDPRVVELVSEMEAGESVVNRAREDVKKMQRARQDAEQVHRRVMALRRKFTSDYTGTYDQFDRRFDLGQLLTGYILGQTIERTFWSNVDKHYYDDTPPPPPARSSWSNSADSSFFGGSDSGGSSFGGGDSGGGASFGGGDSGGGSSSFGGGD